MNSQVLSSCPAPTSAFSFSSNRLWGGQRWGTEGLRPGKPWEVADAEGKTCSVGREGRCGHLCGKDTEPQSGLWGRQCPSDGKMQGIHQDQLHPGRSALSLEGPFNLQLSNKDNVTFAFCFRALQWKPASSCCFLCKRKALCRSCHRYSTFVSFSNDKKAYCRASVV